MRSDTVSQALHARRRRRIDAEGGQDFGVEPFLVIGDRHIVDRRHVKRLDDGGRTHVAELRELASFLGRNLRSARTSRISGAIPMACSSLTECWVGLVLSSPAAAIHGISVRWT
jgi:hypothetical protein